MFGHQTLEVPVPERDREAAAHYGHSVSTIQGDMRDLSCFDSSSFDLIWHAHSLNFVPDAEQVFDGVVRVLRPRGQYRLDCWNPYAHGSDDTLWDRNGYKLIYPYIEGACVDTHEFWEIVPWDRGSPNDSEAKSDTKEPTRIQGPKEFRHTLTTIVNGLITRKLTVLGLWEEDFGDLHAEPGTWQHFKAYAPPWITIWTRKE